MPGAEEGRNASPAAGDCINLTCPWSGKRVSPDSLTTYRGRVVGFCNTECRDKFEAAIMAFDAAIDAVDRAKE